MSGANSLGEYLRARRRLVTPEQAGIPRGSRRRVVGLRREEVALLAAISPEYYLRLEQGRDQNPSAPVLDALAAVLHLDDEASAYLHRLARAAPQGWTPPQGGSRPEVESVPPGVAQLIAELPVPTFVRGRRLDVLAANPLATALSPHYRKGVNLLRAVFLDPADRVLHQDWERATREAVSGLRASAGTDLDDPLLIELVTELSAASDRFRQLWERQDVRQKVGGVSLFLHPVVGEMVLRHEKFLVAGRDGQLMVMYHAAPGSPSHDALRRLQATLPVLD